MKSYMILFLCSCFLCVPISVLSEEPGAPVSGSSSESMIGDGLMEALRVGADRAVASVSAEDGYLGNPAIKIPLPKELQQAESLIRMAGGEKKLNAFTLSMNRAAEKAAPQAKALLLDALKGMSFSDAGKILNGRENEATLFFQEKTSDSLTAVFKPIVHDVMNEVGVTKSFQDIETLSAQAPIKGLKNINLDDYVTGKALEGLFIMIAAEEKKIRTDPAARASDVLKNVFGGKK